MKVLGICCSPRLHGNTEILLREALDAAKEVGAEVELVTLAGKTIAPCDACFSCRKIGGECHIKDDMQGIYPKLSEADGIIFGIPVYFASAPAQAKVLIDRTFVFELRERRELRNKVGGVVVTTARIGATSAIGVFNNFFHIQRMINAGYAVGFTDRQEDGVKGPPDKDRIMSDRLAMREARWLGRTVVRRIEEMELVKEKLPFRKGGA